MAETMMRFTAAQLAKMHESAVKRDRLRIAEEIAGRSLVERTLGNLDTADVLGEIAETIFKSAEDAPKDAERQPARRDPLVQGMVNVAMANAAEVPIGPNVGQPKRVPLTPEQVERETQRLLVPGMEREKFPGWDAVTDDGLAPARERSDAEDIRRLVR